MRSAGPASLLLAASLALGARVVAQRPALAYGLKPGRHDVSIRRLRSPDGGLTAWYPARCGRSAPAPAAPCADAPADSGPFPLVLLAAWEGGLVHDDTVLAVYLASHGYVVAAPASRAAGSSTSPSLDALLASLRALGSVDSFSIAVAGRGRAVAAARDYAARSARVGAVVEVDPPDRAVVSGDSAARRPPTLVVLQSSVGATPSTAPDHLTLHTPSGVERRRLIPAITHLFLSAVVRGWGDPLSTMAARLRRLGL